MRLSSLCVAAVLLFSSAAFAQHSSGASSSSSASSGSSGGGGSHSSSSGGSSSSGSSAGSHSSGGSVSSTSSAHSSGGAVSHVSSARSSSSASVSSHPVVHDPRSNAVPAIREPNAGARGKTEPSEKRGFFTFLRHPFRKPSPSPKPEPKTKMAPNLRRWICVNGPCAICPPGQSRAGGQCTGTVSGNQTRTFCQAGEFSSGGACLLQTRFMDSCSGQRRVMEQQARRMQAAESAQQSACASGSMQDCSNSTGTAQSEANLYRTLQDRYQTCRQRSQAAYPFTRFGFSGYSSGLLFDPLEFDVNYR